MKVMMFFSLMCIYVVSSWADIIIKGQPTPLRYNGQFYSFPTGYVLPEGTNDLFVNMDGVNKVCFISQQYSIRYNQISQVNVFMNGINTEWNCFPYTTTINEVRP